MVGQSRMDSRALGNHPGVHSGIDPALGTVTSDPTACSAARSEHLRQGGWGNT